jgi:hypothetical protein
MHSRITAGLLVTRPKRALRFSKDRKQNAGGSVQGNTGIAAGSSIVHFGVSTGDAQPVINVRGDELLAGKELIKKWSSRETAY